MCASGIGGECKNQARCEREFAGFRSVKTELATKIRSGQEPFYEADNILDRYSEPGKGCLHPHS
jgi:cell fate (sporulation/competence/biofilm development) regulator YlbF (YheA/YmcA/DUF963 family)